MKDINEIWKCDICREYYAHCMVSPLRCPGLGVENGRYYVGRKALALLDGGTRLLKSTRKRKKKEG